MFELSYKGLEKMNIIYTNKLYILQTLTLWKELQYNTTKHIKQMFIKNKFILFLYY